MTPDSLGMRHEGSVGLYRYWLHLRAGRPAPYRAEFTPEGVGRSLAANTFILERTGAANLRFRLSGSALFDIFGVELRGMSAASLMREEDRSKIAALASSVLLGGRVAVGHCVLEAPDGSTTDAELFMAPLKSDFDQIDRILGAVHIFGDGPISAIPRRCALRGTRIIELDEGSGAQRHATTALPGFAEAAQPFGRATPPLTAIAGGKPAGHGGDGRAPTRKAHLRLIKNDLQEDPSDG